MYKYVYVTVSMVASKQRFYYLKKNIVYLINTRWVVKDFLTFFPYHFIK